MEKAAEILSCVKEYFDLYELDYDIFPDDNVLKSRLEVSGKLKTITLYIVCRDYSFTIYAGIDMKADEDCRLAVAEYITRANYGRTFGNFEMNFGDGEIRFRLTQDCTDRTSTDYLIGNAIAVLLIPFHKYGDGLLSVMFGVKSPKEAIKDAEGAKDDSCG